MCVSAAGPDQRRITPRLAPSVARRAALLLAAALTATNTSGCRVEDELPPPLAAREVDVPAQDSTPPTLTAYLRLPSGARRTITESPEDPEQETLIEPLSGTVEVIAVAEDTEGVKELLLVSELRVLCARGQESELTFVPERIEDKGKDGESRALTAREVRLSIPVDRSGLESRCSPGFTLEKVVARFAARASSYHGGRTELQGIGFDLQ
jgi:hypothetical protein